MADFVKPGNAAPGAGPGSNPTESQLSRVANSNAAVVEEMSHLRATTKALFDAVIEHSKKIDSHGAALTGNTALLGKLLDSNTALDRNLDSLIDAIKENTMAINQHRDDLKVNTDVVKDHQAASLKLVQAVKDLS